MKPPDGTCEHYGQVDYRKRLCLMCWMCFLACPICKQVYCPDCRSGKLRIKADVPYYKAKQKSVAKKKSLARLEAWKQNHKEMVGERA